MITKLDLDLMSNPLQKMNFERDTMYRRQDRHDLAPMHYDFSGTRYEDRLIMDDIYKRTSTFSTHNYMSRPEKKKCPRCDGKGGGAALKHAFSFTVVTWDCKKCGGTGYV